MKDETVQLQKFVASALTQIALATMDAGKALQNTGAIVVPRVMGGPGTAAQAGHLRSARRMPVTMVTFDVAVTATVSDETLRNTILDRSPRMSQKRARPMQSTATRKINKA